jgi:kumamolisin
MSTFRPSFRHAPKADRISDVDPAGIVQLTVVLRPGAPIPEHTHGGPGLSHAAFRAKHGTKPEVMSQIRAFAERFHLEVVSEDPGAHQVKLRGTYADAIAAFQPEGIGVFGGPHGKHYVARTGHIQLPEEFAGEVVAVMGFDQRPVAQPHFRAVAASGQTSYTPIQVAAAYKFPTGLDGTGQTIALIELGGGYADADVAAYFTAIGVNRTGTLVSVGVDGAGNAPDGNPAGADGEVQLDIEVAGAVAPAANIAVYFAPNQGSGFRDAISDAANDQTNAPSVMSISWGGPESGYSQQDLDAIDQALASAVALGITVCVASGDNGATDGATDGQKHVDFPASSPNALGCGGTSLPPGGPEVAWNDGAKGGASGGGYSASFPIPAWQTGVGGTMRGVPDVAGDADPRTGYQVSVDGSSTVIGGTSAVAPLWAGLVALINQSAGKRSGFINPALYTMASTAFTDITEGNNNGYSAGPGWDPVTGLGSPLGTRLLAALGGPVPTS